jgi:aminoglycoside 6'-N-acetyltransferase
LLCTRASSFEVGTSCSERRLTIDPAADNEAAIAGYSKVGFTAVGVMRSYERREGGDWTNGLLMDMLTSDQPAD